VIVDDDPATATGFAIADNRTAELAEWDDEVLARLLEAVEEEMPAVELGFTDEDLAELLNMDDGPIGEDVEPTEAPADPVSKRGEVYELGPHRLMCGDSTSKEDVEALLEGATPVVIVTDPPYSSGARQENMRRGSTSVGRNGAKVGEIARDNLTTAGYRELIRCVLSRCEFVDVVYMWTDWRMWTETHGILESSGFPVRNMIVWAKESPGMGFPWRQQHELVAFARKSSPPMPEAGDGCFGNVLQVSRDVGNRPLHPTVKPLDVIEPLIANSRERDDVYDPFLGSGTTIIAAARQGRRCYGLEISPAYCDVIRKRWGDYARQNDLEPGKGAL
jgi:DNA modification methylase